MTGRPRFWLIALTLLAVAVRVGWASAQIAQGQHTVDNGDYVLYAVGAEHIATHGDFSNSLFLVRPPLFPLIVALLGNDIWRVLLLNSVIGGLTALWVYGIARRLGLSAPLALVATAIFALDPLSIHKGAVILDPVPISAFFVSGMSYALLGLYAPQSVREQVILGGLAGAALGLAMLTRPESYLIWTGLGVALLVTARHAWRGTLIYMAVAALVLAGWTIHNGRVFGHLTFSTVSGFTIAFYRAASVQRMATDAPMDDIYLDITQRVEARLGHDPQAATLDTRWGYHAASPEVLSALYSVSLDTFRQYPVEYVLTAGVGLLRFYGMDPPMTRGLPVNATSYVVWGWNLLLCGASVLGFWRLWAEYGWKSALWVVLIVGYFTVGTLLVKNAALEGRERASLNPYLAICATVAANWLWRRVGAKG